MLATSSSRRLLPILLLAFTLGGAFFVGPRQAWAVRVVSFEILLDGKLVLRGQVGDNGNANANEVWDYLKTLEFQEPERRFVPEKERAADDFHIVPDEGNPLQATLRGEIRLFARYGGDIRVKELKLVRATPKATKWRLSPEDFQRTKATRTIDPTKRAR
ncbi:MAG: hypothetical protein U1A77_06225 [Pirellulales bacterium]